MLGKEQEKEKEQEQEKEQVGSETVLMSNDLIKTLVENLGKGFERTFPTLSMLEGKPAEPMVVLSSVIVNVLDGICLGLSDFYYKITEDLHHEMGSSEDIQMMFFNMLKEDTITVMARSVMYHRASALRSDIEELIGGSLPEDVMMSIITHLENRNSTEVVSSDDSEESEKSEDSDDEDSDYVC